MSEIFDEYVRRRSTPSDIFEHLAYMHHFVVNHDAQTVVELGVRSGNSTAAFLAAVDITDGHVWSVDIDAAPAMPESDRWTFIRGDDLKVAAQLPDEIDVLFIDTSHLYEHTLAELRLYGPRADWILLHDTELRRPYMAPKWPSYPVKTAVEQWCTEVGRPWTNRTNCYGLGTIGR